MIEGLQRDGHLTEPGLEQKEPQAGMPEPNKPRAEPELQATPSSEIAIRERIDSSIRRVQEACQCAAADAEGEQQERSGYGARIAHEAQYEAEPAHPWPSSQAENRSPQMDYEPEL